MDTAPKDLPKIRMIQFQMATCPETGASFNITSDIPRDASATEIATELATLREAGYFEMAAANRRKLERAKIIKDSLLEKLQAAKQRGDPIKSGKITEAKENAFTTFLEMETECEADESMLLRNAPLLQAPEGN
jgi:hypothetical protein